MWEKGQGFPTHKPETAVAKDICQKKKETYARAMTHFKRKWFIEH